MTAEALAGIDLSRGSQPDPALGERELLEEWLRYQRHEFLRKLRDLDAVAMAAWAIPPVELSVLGLVRHMTQMEHVYLSWGLGGGTRAMAYGDDDYAGGSVDTVDEDVTRYLREIEAAEAAVARLPSLDTEGAGHGWPLRATLVKMIDEYALHAGQAHMLRFAAIGEMIR